LIEALDSATPKPTWLILPCDKPFPLWTNHQSPAAEEALRFFAAIYDIERLASELEVDQRTRLRVLKTKPILDTFHDWLALQREKATDGTAIAKAIDYSLNRWEALVRFAGDGHLPPDNNAVENAIRPFALGRKNWLFSDTQRGVIASANLYSLIETAKANHINDYAYLKLVFTALPAARTDDQLRALLPWNVDPATLDAQLRKPA
jgi:hypothetical protein